MPGRPGRRTQPASTNLRSVNRVNLTLAPSYWRTPAPSFPALAACAGSTLIEDGEYASITDFAKAENVNQSYACRILRLTLLAPRIIAEILDGQTASDLMLKRIMRPLPARWDEQMTALARWPRSD